MALPDINQVDEHADSIARGSMLLAKAWRSILTALGLASLTGIVGLIFLALYEGREQVAADLYGLITTGKTDSALLLDEWSLVPPDEFVEFWDCQPGGCVPNDERRQAVNERLSDLVAETGANRAVFSLYGQNYRRIAAQSTRLGQRSLEQSLWLVPLSQDGYDDNVAKHLRDECNSIIVQNLSDGSLLRIEAPLYNTARLENCPVNESNPLTGRDDPRLLKGYVTADFADMDVDVADVEERLQDAAEDIEEIMGW